MLLFVEMLVRRKPRVIERKGRSAVRSRGFVNPPMFRSNIVHRHKFRFAASAAFTKTLTGNAMLGAAGCMGTVVNTSVVLFHTAVKVRSIEMWATPAALGGTATVSVNWLGGNNSPNIEVSDTTLSTATNAHVLAIPPVSSLAKFWQNVNVAPINICTLVGPAGTIVDVDCDLILGDQDATLLVVAVATAALGQIYYLALDEADSSTHILVPVSLASTF